MKSTKGLPSSLVINSEIVRMTSTDESVGSDVDVLDMSDHEEEVSAESRPKDSLLDDDPEEAALSAAAEGEEEFQSASFIHVRQI